MPRLTGDTVLTTEGAYLSATVEDEEVLPDPESGNYYGVNPVGAHVLALIEGQAVTVDGIVDAVAGGFDVDRERAETDVVEYLDDLVSEGLVDVADDG